LLRDHEGTPKKKEGVEKILGPTPGGKGGLSREKVSPKHRKTKRDDNGKRSRR